jgi:chromosome segregation ATPase
MTHDRQSQKNTESELKALNDSTDRSINKRNQLVTEFWKAEQKLVHLKAQQNPPSRDIKAIESEITRLEADLSKDASPDEIKLNRGKIKMLEKELHDNNVDFSKPYIYCEPGKSRS